MKFNDLNTNGTAASGGAVTLDGTAGPVSITLKAVGTNNPVSHTTSVTLYRGLRRVDLRNEVTTGLDDTMRYSSYRTALAPSPDTRHEEVGAVLRAKLTTTGGDYAVKNARYDFLTMNHFIAMTGTIAGNAAGLTLSNADGYFFRLGKSTISSLDTSTAAFHPVLAGRPNNGTGMAGQAGDSYFEQRYALRTHTTFDRVAAMKFSLEHQNPLVCGAVTGTEAGPYPAAGWSYLTIDNPDVLLWALKPHDDGIANGIVARVWNHATTPSAMQLTAATGPFASAKRLTHLETPVQNLTLGAGALADNVVAQKIETYAFVSTPLSGFEAWKIANGLPVILSTINDDDRDGIGLFLEYALALDPAQPLLTGLPTIALDSPPTTISFRHLRARANLQYIVTTSTDLDHWTATGIAQGTALPGQMNTATMPFTNEPKRFLRLEITQP